MQLRAAFRCAYELVGSSGSIRVPDAYLPPPDSPVAHRTGVEFETPGGSVPEPMTFPGTNQYACMVDAFARSVSAGALVDPAEDGLAQMRVLDAIKGEALDA